MTPKLVPFFPNTDQVRCQQACVKSVLKYFLPNREFSDTEIDEGTAQTGGTTWFPPAAMFFDKAGLSVQLFYTSVQLDYEELAKRGTEYIRSTVSTEDFQIQEENGAFLAMSVVQEAAKKMLEKGIVKGEAIDIEDLRIMLDGPDALAIGKTFQPWLSGIHERRSAHYVVIIRSYNQTSWRIHDPGPPPISDRKVAKKFEGEPMFSEVLIIARKK